ncbi:MAG: radical SAM protein [Pseudomonadota bacterium]
MADILLIQPPVRDFYLTRKRTIPYGLASIAAVLIQNGFTVELFDSLATKKSRFLDYPQEMDYLRQFYGKPDLSPFALFHLFQHFGYSYEHIGMVAKQSQAFLVGISSLFSAYHNEAVKTAEIVKERHPDCKIVIGGHHATHMPETVMQSKAVDFLLRGEGEVSMPLLAKAIREDLPFQHIPGIVYREESGSLVIHPPAVMSHPDHYPLPATGLVKKKYYQRNKAGSISVVASRGCPMKCSYCSVGKSGLPYRRRSVASVLHEIESATVLEPVRFVDFEDENLSLDKKWFLSLLRGIENRFGHLNMELRAMNGLFPPSLDQEVMEQMKASGFKTINLSIGSTSPDQLLRFSRPDVRKPLEKVLQIAGMLKMETVCYVIAGAPDQKAADSVRDLLYLAGYDTIAGVSIFYPAPGSPDFEKCSVLKLLPGQVSLMRSTAFPISHTTSRKEAVTILRLGRILNFMKHLIRKGEGLPEPRLFQGENLSDVEDREEKGKHLLSWFLFDGRIMGTTTTGDVFEHQTDSKLTGLFRIGMQLLLDIQTHMDIVQPGNNGNGCRDTKQQVEEFRRDSRRNNLI